VPSEKIRSSPLQGRRSPLLAPPVQPCARRHACGLAVRPIGLARIRVPVTVNVSCPFTTKALKPRLFLWRSKHALDPKPTLIRAGAGYASVVSHSWSLMTDLTAILLSQTPIRTQQFYRGSELANDL
jgi:hypothetical protein